MISALLTIKLSFVATSLIPTCESAMASRKTGVSIFDISLTFKNSDWDLRYMASSKVLGIMDLSSSHHKRSLNLLSPLDSKL